MFKCLINEKQLLDVIEFAKNKYVQKKHQVMVRLNVIKLWLSYQDILVDNTENTQNNITKIFHFWSFS